MSCFYCGKSVSLTRKLTDPDFCCEAHRQEYHERTRRGLSRVLEADEQISRRRNRLVAEVPPGPFRLPPVILASAGLCQVLPEFRMRLPHLRSASAGRVAAAPLTTPASPSPRGQTFGTRVPNVSPVVFRTSGFSYPRPTWNGRRLSPPASPPVRMHCRTPWTAGKTIALIVQFHHTCTLPGRHTTRRVTHEPARAPSIVVPQLTESISRAAATGPRHAARLSFRVLRPILPAVSRPFVHARLAGNSWIAASPHAPCNTLQRIVHIAHQSESSPACPARKRRLRWQSRFRLVQESAWLKENLQPVAGLFVKRLTLTVEFRLFEPVKERLVAGLAIATENASGHGMSAGGLREELLPYAMGDKSVAAVLGVAKDEPVSPLAGPRSPRFSRAGKPLELTGAELLPLAVTLPAGLRRVRDLAPPRFGVAQAGARLGSLHGRHERRTGTCAAVGFQDFETPAPEPGHKGRSRVSEFPFTVVPFACEATHKSSAPALLDGRVYLPGSLPAPCQAIPADPPCEDRVPLTTKTFLPERNLMPVKDQFELALLNSLRQRLHSRATVRLDEDFASGLENWRGGVKYWRQDAAGVRIGPLALFRPSLELTDYKLEFLGRIENRNIAWVFRAEDLNNYYAMKLKVVIAGASATVVLVRYAVIAGKEGPSVQVPLPIPAPGSTPCKVQLTVEGEEFTTFINGQKVDSWSDGRLKVGGIGFFGDTEDRPRLYWVKVSHQDDSLGRLCAQASRSLESVSTPALGVGNEQSTSENGQRDPFSRAFSN